MTLSGLNCRWEIIVALSSEWEALRRRTGSQRVGPDCRCCRPRVQSMDGTPTSGGNPSPAAACDESRPGGEGSPGALELSINEYRLNRIGSESIGKEEALYPLLESVQATETSQMGTLGDSRGVALLRVPRCTAWWAL